MQFQPSPAYYIVQMSLEDPFVSFKPGLSHTPNFSLAIATREAYREGSVPFNIWIAYLTHHLGDFWANDMG